MLNDKELIDEKHKKPTKTKINCTLILLLILNFEFHTIFTPLLLFKQSISRSH